MELAAARDLLRGAGGDDGRVTLDTISHEGIAVLTIDNSARRNALTTGMMVRFAEAVDELEGWRDGRAVILTGAMDTFCSGADLRGSDAFFTPGHGAAMNAVMTDACTRLLNLPLISISAVSGHAMGGGAELATATDFRLMAADAQLQFVHVQRGLVPGWGGAGRLIELAGRKAALYLLASGKKLSAHGAAQLNLADSIATPTPETPLVAHAVEFLAPLLHRGTAVQADGVRAMKRLVSGSASAPTKAEAASREAALFQSLWGSETQMGFVRAFR
jgi:ethylmalonyl-CoA/methylmalonyl-CoA decarboxylase